MSTYKILRTAFVLLPLAGTSLFAAEITKEDLKVLNQLASAQLSKDFRIVFHKVKNAHICGGDSGDAYIGQVQMNMYQRGSDEKGPKISDSWVDIDRHYSIYKGELTDSDRRLFDPNQCME